MLTEPTHDFFQRHMASPLDPPPQDGLGLELLLPPWVDADVVADGDAVLEQALHDAHALGLGGTWPVSPPALRCLDGSHGAGCTRCAAAPAVGCERAAALVGAAGRKDGAEALRAALTRTPEWRSDACRAEAAVALEADARTAHLADAVRRKLPSGLRKAHLAALCRAWGYRSDRWAVKAALTRSAPRQRPRAHAAPAPHAPAPPRAPTPPLLSILAHARASGDECVRCVAAGDPASPSAPVTPACCVAVRAAQRATRDALDALARAHAAALLPPPPSSGRAPCSSDALAAWRGVLANVASHAQREALPRLACGAAAGLAAHEATRAACGGEEEEEEASGQPQLAGVTRCVLEVHIAFAAALWGAWDARHARLEEQLCAGGERVGEGC